MSSQSTNMKNKHIEVCAVCLEAIRPNLKLKILPDVAKRQGKDKGRCDICGKKRNYTVAYLASDKGDEW